MVTFFFLTSNNSKTLRDGVSCLTVVGSTDEAFFFVLKKLHANTRTHTKQKKRKETSFPSLSKLLFHSLNWEMDELDKFFC